MTKYNFHGRDISDKIPQADGQWYNLTTHRQNIHKKKDLIYHPTIRVCGSQDDINFFIEENKLAIKEETKTDKPEATCTLGILALASKIAKISLVDKTSETKLDYNFIELHEQEPDIFAMTDRELEQVPLFSHKGYKTKARIINVKDGDTFDIVFNLPFVNKTKKYWMQYRDTVRLNKLDAQEIHGKSKEYGFMAKTHFENKIKSMSGKVYVELGNFDLYGRLLADVYEDEKYTKSIFGFCLALRAPNGTHLYNEYNGGTKKAFACDKVT